MNNKLIQTYYHSSPTHHPHHFSLNLFHYHHLTKPLFVMYPLRLQDRLSLNPFASTFSASYIPSHILASGLHNNSFLHVLCGLTCKKIFSNGHVPASPVNNLRSNDILSHLWGHSSHWTAVLTGYILILLALCLHHKDTCFSSLSLTGLLVGMKQFHLQTSLLLQWLKHLLPIGYLVLAFLPQSPRTRDASWNRHYGLN